LKPAGVPVKLPLHSTRYATAESANIQLLKARTYKEKQNNLDILLAETIILSKSMGVHDIEAVLKAELGVFDQELYQEATKEFLEKL